MSFPAPVTALFMSDCLMQMIDIFTTKTFVITTHDHEADAAHKVFFFRRFALASLCRFEMDSSGPDPGESLGAIPKRAKTPRKRYCCVPDCSTTTSVPPFFNVPSPAKNPEQRELFLKAIDRVNPDGSCWDPKPGMEICSRHFVSGKPSPTRNSPDYYPTKYLGKATTPKTEADVARFNRHMKRRFDDSSRTASASKDPPAIAAVQPAAAEPDEFMEMCAAFSSVKVDVHVQTEVHTRDANIGTTHEAPKHATAQTELKSTEFQRSFNVQLFDDAQMKSFTGVSRQIFAFLLHKLNEALGQTNFATEPMLELFLVKCKLNLTYTVVSGMFGVRKETASRWFKKVTHILHNKLSPYIIWFDKPRIIARMPPRFKALYPKTRVIIDGTEIKTDRPSKQKMRIHLWSNYKHAYTIKLLIGIAPSGEITFISKAFGGRATDTEITVRSGIVQLLEPGDQVMADKERNS